MVCLFKESSMASYRRQSIESKPDAVLNINTEAATDVPYDDKQRKITAEQGSPVSGRDEFSGLTEEVIQPFVSSKGQTIAKRARKPTQKETPANNKKKTRKSDTDESSYLCGICGKYFANIDNLQRHCRIHTKRELTCKTCKVKFKHEHSHKCNPKEIEKQSSNAQKSDDKKFNIKRSEENFVIPINNSFHTFSKVTRVYKNTKKRISTLPVNAHNNLSTDYCNDAVTKAVTELSPIMNNAEIKKVCKSSSIAENVIPRQEQATYANSELTRKPNQPTVSRISETCSEEAASQYHNTMVNVIDKEIKTEIKEEPVDQENGDLSMTSISKGCVNKKEGSEPIEGNQDDTAGQVSQDSNGNLHGSQFRCEPCRQYFCTESFLSVHSRFHQRLQLCSCEICDMRYKPDVDSEDTRQDICDPKEAIKTFFNVLNSNQKSNQETYVEQQSNIQEIKSQMLNNCKADPNIPGSNEGQLLQNPYVAGTNIQSSKTQGVNIFSAPVVQHIQNPCMEGLSSQRTLGINYQHINQNVQKPYIEGSNIQNLQSLNAQNVHTQGTNVSSAQMTHIVQTPYVQGSNVQSTQDINVWSTHVNPIIQSPYVERHISQSTKVSNVWSTKMNKHGQIFYVKGSNVFNTPMNQNVQNFNVEESHAQNTPNNIWNTRINQSAKNLSTDGLNMQRTYTDDLNMRSNQMTGQNDGLNDYSHMSDINIQKHLMSVDGYTGYLNKIEDANRSRVPVPHAAKTNKLVLNIQEGEHFHRIMNNKPNVQRAHTAHNAHSAKNNNTHKIFKNVAVPFIRKTTAVKNVLGGNRIVKLCLAGTNVHKTHTEELNERNTQLTEHNAPYMKENKIQVVKVGNSSIRRVTVQAFRKYATDAHNANIAFRKIPNTNGETLYVLTQKGEQNVRRNNLAGQNVVQKPNVEGVNAQLVRIVNSNTEMSNITKTNSVLEKTVPGQKVSNVEDPHTQITPTNRLNVKPTRISAQSSQIGQINIRADSTKANINRNHTVSQTVENVYKGDENVTKSYKIGQYHESTHEDSLNIPNSHAAHKNQNFQKCNVKSLNLEKIQTNTNEQITTKSTMVVCISPVYDTNDREQFNSHENIQRVNIETLNDQKSQTETSISHKPQNRRPIILGKQYLETPPGQRTLIKDLNFQKDAISFSKRKQSFKKTPIQEKDNVIEIKEESSTEKINVEEVVQDALNRSVELPKSSARLKPRDKEASTGQRTERSPRVAKELSDFFPVYNPHSCDVCGKQFLKKSGLARHYQTHNPHKYLYTCDKCNREFTTTTGLTRHRDYFCKKSDIDRRISCQKCQKEFGSIMSLYNHQRYMCYVKTGSMPFACNLCTNKYPEEYMLTRHVKIKHDSKPYECEICNKICNGLFLYNRHILSHTGFKPFQCGLCPKAFLRKNHLKSHEIKHTGVKFNCKECGKEFNDRAVRRKHEKFNCSETCVRKKPYVCDVCKRRYATKSSIRQHLQSQHTVSFRCDLCNKAFGRKLSLMIHLHRHTGIFPTCDVCKKWYIKKETLIKHLRTH